MGNGKQVTMSSNSTSQITKQEKFPCIDTDSDFTNETFATKKQTFRRTVKRDVRFFFDNKLRQEVDKGIEFEPRDRPALALSSDTEP